MKKKVKKTWYECKYVDNCIFADFSTKMGDICVSIIEENGKFSYDAYLTKNGKDDHIVFCKKKDRANSLKDAKKAVFYEISNYMQSLIDDLENKANDARTKISRVCI